MCLYVCVMCTYGTILCEHEHWTMFFTYYMYISNVFGYCSPSTFTIFSRVSPPFPMFFFPFMWECVCFLFVKISIQTEIHFQWSTLYHFKRRIHFVFFLSYKPLLNLTSIRLWMFCGCFNWIAFCHKRMLKILMKL